MHDTFELEHANTVAGAYFALPLAVAAGDLGENGRLQLQGAMRAVALDGMGPCNCYTCRRLFTALLPAATASTDIAWFNIACGSCERQYGVNIAGRSCGVRFPAFVKGQ